MKFGIPSEIGRPPGLVPAETLRRELYTQQVKLQNDEVSANWLTPAGRCTRDEQVLSQTLYMVKKNKKTYDDDNDDTTTTRTTTTTNNKNNINNENNNNKRSNDVSATGDDVLFLAYFIQRI